VLDAATGEEILPVFWSDNYVSLLPGQRMALTAELSGTACPPALAVACDGWNTDPITLDPAAGR